MGVKQSPCMLSLQWAEENKYLVLAKVLGYGNFASLPEQELLILAAEAIRDSIY